MNPIPQNSAEPAETPSDALPVGPASRLPRHALTYENIKAGLVWLATVVAIVIARVVVPQEFPLWLAGVLVVAGAATLAADVLFVNRWRCRTYRYRLSPEATVIAHGRFFLHERSIPTARTFGVELVQGPLLRAFGLVELRIVTVVGSHPLGPVLQDEGERIRALFTSAAQRGLHG